MGFQDRRYREPGDYGEGGGFKRAMRRIFVEGDDFFSWSLPLFTVPRWVPGIHGIQVRMHLLFVVFIVAQMIWPIRRDAMGFAFEAFSLGWLWVFVVLHEFGHCLACRKVGGEADRVLLWPLGGLAACRPPHNWKASLITTLGGPGVNFVLIPILGAVLLWQGAGWDAIIFNPFNPASAWFSDWLTHDTSYFRVFLWTAHYMNLVLFVFNMALVMYPMDAGRVVQELLWWRLGYKKSMLIATNLGLIVAVAVGMFALVTKQNMLFGVAVFGGLTCFQQRRNIAMMEDEPAWAYDTDRGYQGFGKANAPSTRAGRAAAEQDKAYAAALKNQQKQRDTQAEVDRILDKIREQGMASLTRKEKAVLKDATERQRGAGA